MGYAFGVVEVQYTWRHDPLCVIVNNVDVVHSLIFTSGLRPSLPAPAAVQDTPPGIQTTEGMWWKEEPGVSAFVALSNTAAQPLKANLEVSDNMGRILAQHSVAISPHGTKMVRLPELQAGSNKEGGLRVVYDGPNEALIVNGHLQDPATGYSASIPFTKETAASETSATTSFAELGLMNGAADPMLSFPAGTTFTPFSVIRNISDQAVTLKPHIFWMEGGKARSASLGLFPLQSHETQAMDVPALLAKAGLPAFNGSMNLAFDVQGKQHSILVASGSVDQKKTYVFQGVPRAVQQSQSKTISYWSTANGDDTMVTIWNPADEVQDFVFTLYFASGHYDFPIHLEPRATRMLNVSEIIQNQIPDRDGNIIPPTVHQGSAKLSGSRGEAEDILVALDAGTYNVRKATCSYYCITCAGYYELLLGIVPYTVGTGLTKQLRLTGDYSSGTQQDLTSSGSWSSSAASVATVTTGLVKGVAAGSASISGFANVPIASTYCAYDPQSCSGGYGNLGSSGPGTVVQAPTISSITPNSGLTGLLVPVTIFGTGFAPSPATNGISIQGINASVVSISSDGKTMGATFDLSTEPPGGYSISVVLSTVDNGTVPSSNSGAFTVIGAIPNGFTQISPSGPVGGGNLKFTYTWGSSTNNVEDLAQCAVRENVIYSGMPTPKFFWAQPPYDNAGYKTDNPTLTPISATDGGFFDNQLHPGFLKPYTANTLLSTQTFEFSCPYYQSGKWTLFSSTFSITRKVLNNPPWEYRVTKSGYTASMALP